MYEREKHTEKEREGKKEQVSKGTSEEKREHGVERERSGRKGEKTRQAIVRSELPAKRISYVRVL